MTWYIRKTLRKGPVRANVSKSGIGVSVGVPGLRVGRNAKGKYYIHAGIGGLYWRKEFELPTTKEPAGCDPGQQRSTSLPTKNEVFNGPSKIPLHECETGLARQHDNRTEAGDSEER